MDSSLFNSIKPQLEIRGFNSDDLNHAAWDTYNNSIERDRVVKRGRKSVRCVLIDKTERRAPDSDDVLSEWEREVKLDLFHHNMTNPVDRNRHIERNGDFDMKYGNVTYEYSAVQQTDESIENSGNSEGNDYFKDMN